MEIDYGKTTLFKSELRVYRIAATYRLLIGMDLLSLDAAGTLVLDNVFIMVHYSDVRNFSEHIS